MNYIGLVDYWGLNIKAQRKYLEKYISGNPLPNPYEEKNVFYTDNWHLYLTC